MGLYNKRNHGSSWAKLGDEHIAFFRSMATIRYKRNKIARFTMRDGTGACDHNKKVAILLQAQDLFIVKFRDNQF